MACLLFHYSIILFLTLGIAELMLMHPFIHFVFVTARICLWRED